MELIQEIILAAALVLETVLLAALLERRNWPFVRVPIVAMLAGAWLWHCGLFALLLAADLPGSWPWYLQRSCMLAMAAGALLMPCGLLHAAWRASRSKLEVVQSRPRHGLAYLPMLCVLPVAHAIFAYGSLDFRAITRPFEMPYFLFAGAVNLLAAGVFLGVGRGLQSHHARLLVVLMAPILVGMTALQGLALLTPLIAPHWDGYARFAVAMSPLVPALLFAYFVVRYHFMQIILSRSVVYGVILGSVVFLHQLAFQDITGLVPEHLRLHVLVLETMVVAILVLSYEPLRQRSAEALRYLLGTRVSAIRERLRQLSTELSTQAGKPSHELLPWFVAALRECLHVEFVSGWLFDEGGALSFPDSNCPYWSRDRATWLFERMRTDGHQVCSPRHSSDTQIDRCLQEGAAALAALKLRPYVAGLLIVGRGKYNRDLGEEETSAVLLLIEQLAITLDNSALQARQMAAERQALQAEKLAALGLLASSIAHEVKNPLSAIKTIATVLAEDLGPDSPHAEDLRLIVGEVERLAATTTQLLETARPRSGPPAPASLPQVLDGMLQLFRHAAARQDIVIETCLADNLPLVQADAHVLREIFFNLLSNSLEAAGTGGRVAIDCRRVNGYVTTRVSDSGPGISEEVRRRLFEPFFTTKQTGNGLGLYAVARHVGALGGSIQCDSSLGQGTSFTIQLPSIDDHA
jgi:signal transduction histidine kinase